MTSSRAECLQKANVWCLCGLSTVARGKNGVLKLCKLRCEERDLKE